MAATAIAIYRSSVGKKFLMAITGLIGIGFLVVHMYGNLKIFEGPEYFNNYAAGLRSFGAPVLAHGHFLWIARLTLLAAVGIHIAMAYQLTRQDWAGRGTRYKVKRDVQATFASRTMRWGGVILLLFIIYHIANLTLGLVGYGPGQYRHPEGDVYSAYSNTINAFRFWPTTILYIVAMLALGMHLYHGFWSMFQTLGLNSYRTNALLRYVSIAVAAVLTIGFIIVPLSVMFGIVQ